MTVSRRALMQALGAGAVSFAAARSVPADAAQPVPPEFGSASSADAELKIVSCARLEDQARKIFSPGRFAIMGWQGDGWTYHENLRAFNDYPIMPRRLHGVSEQAIDLRTRSSATRCRCR